MSLQDFKAQTIQQFCVLEYLSDNFSDELFVDIHFMGRTQLLTIDSDGKKAIVTYFSPKNIEFRKVN